MNAVRTDTPLWTTAEAIAATGGQAEGADWQARGVSIDSRSCAAGDLFIALTGPNFDGHDYVAAAFEAGAAAAIVARRPDGLPEGASLVLVDNTDTALDDLGRFARNRTGAQITAITGSVGKTGTKEGLAHALANFGATHATQGNLNNQWGVPLSLARMPQTTRYGVFELGMNHAGELTPLSKLVRPDVAIITTIAAAHLEFFDSVGAIAEAKAEIFAGMSHQGVAILNRDNPWFATLAEIAWSRGIEAVIGFGEHHEAQVRLERYQPTEEGCDVGAVIAGQNLRYRLAARGRHAAINSLAILAAADALGVDINVAAAALATLQPPKGRGRRSEVKADGGTFLLIDDSYNASPASMRAAFEVLATTPVTEGRRIAVLGDMLELGNDAPRLHSALAGPLAKAGIDLVFTAGPNMAGLFEALPPAIRGGHAETSQELLAALHARIGAGDAVLVKGSLGSRMGLIVDAFLETDGAPGRAAQAG